MIELNEEQLKAITVPSPILVFASAGAGKTRCLIAKILSLLESGTTHPINICAVTFTNKAAKEIKERIEKYYSVKDMQVSTIHSLCVRVIRKFIQLTPLKYPFSIYDDDNQKSIIKTLLKARKMLDDPEEILSKISRYKGGQENGANFDQDIYDAYQDVLVKNNACDFDDLLVYAHLCLQNRECKQYFSNLWQHILVDEFQDTSVIQFKIIKSLYTEKTKTLFIIGDRNQSIYSWRGANPENIDDFIKEFNPSICSLTFNYRSSSEIITHANTFLQYGNPMVTKNNTIGKVTFTQFRDREDEANKIADAIKTAGDYENTAILFRVNSRTLEFEKAFTLKRIPYKIYGALPFYRRKVCKDLLSYCKAALNRSDIESLTRIVNVPKRGFGDKKQEQLLLEGWSFLEQIAIDLPPIESLINLLNTIEHKQPIHAIEEIIKETNYKNLLIKDTDHFLLDAFLDVVSGFNTLEELILASTFLEEDSGHGIKLMTAHSSKGLEFDRVFVVGVEKDVWPHKFSENINEEFRLYYVATTRAKSWINISYSKTQLYRGTKLDVQPSSLFTDSYQFWRNSRRKK